MKNEHEKMLSEFPKTLEEMAAMYGDMAAKAQEVVQRKTYYFLLWKQADNDYKAARRKRVWELRREGATVSSAEAQAYDETVDLRTASVDAECLYQMYSDVYFSMKAKGMQI